MKILYLIPLLFSLAACTAPQSPAQAVFQLQSAYAVSLSAEVAYAKLPRCKDDVIRLCSKKGIVEKVKRASDIAWASIKASQDAVRTPEFGNDVTVTTLASADAAVKAYQSIIIAIGKD